ncbi:MAG: alpha/beta hydrolase fold domain-containing protein [Acidimicrobiales bacterium]
MDGPALEDRRASLSTLRRLIFSSSVPWERQRARFAAATSATPVARGVVREAVTIGSLRVETLTPRDVTLDRAIIYVHGGGYCIGSPAMGRALGSFLAVTLRATLYGLDYRLAPEHPAPAAVQDVTALLEYLAGHEVVGLADSAGAGALVAALVAGAAPVGALALVSPWLDPLRPYDGDLAERDPLLSIGWLEACARAYTRGARNELGSPLRASWAGLAPTVVVGAEDDLTAPDAAALAAREFSGVTVRTWPGLWHDFALALGQLPEATGAAEVIAHHLAGAMGWRRVEATGW